MLLEDYFKEQEVSDDLMNELFSLFQYKEYKTGNVILDMGENTNVVCLILKGIVRGYYLDDDGNEVTKCFSEEGDWCCFYNFLQQGPSSFVIEALEDCRMAQIRVGDLREVLVKYASLQHIYEKLAKKAFLQVEEKSASFQRANAKERYVLFKQKHSDLIQRVKQEYIASYLGITPSSLSRIKRDL